MEERKLLVSHEAVEKFGILAFDGLETDDFIQIADPDNFIELETGMLLSMDDMRNLYLSSTEVNETFIEIDDLKKRIKIAKKCKYFNMKEICDICNIPYISFKTFKQKNYLTLSDERIDSLIRVMSTIMED
jgi:hypothetical protein